jgi:hypothetical protein
MLLDPIAQDALRLLALTFQRCGYAPEQVISAFSSYMKNPPPSVSADQRNPELELHDAGHVLTLWNSDPDYVDDEGKPRPIPARGAAPSIEALAMRVRSTLRFEDVLGILERTRAVRKKARLYVPLDDTVLHAPDSKTQSVHHLLVLNQLLHNFEFNSRRALGTASWPQRVADCPDFPEDELPAFIARFTELARRFMTARDRDMARIARKAGPAIARVRPEINLFLTVAPTMEEARKKRSP